MNVYLLERQLKRLEVESKKTGSAVAELIRRAIDIVYPPFPPFPPLELLEKKE